MAITDPRGVNPSCEFGGVNISTSVKGHWVTCHANSGDTAQSAGELIQPGTCTSANIIPIKLGPNCVRALFRCRYTAAGAVTTSPVIRIFGAYGALTTTLTNDGTVKYVILASAQPLTCTVATDVRDTTYGYSPPLSLTPTDLLGADYLIVFVETASSIAGAQTEIIECCLMN